MHNTIYSFSVIFDISIIKQFVKNSKFTNKFFVRASLKYLSDLLKYFSEIPVVDRALIDTKKNLIALYAIPILCHFPCYVLPLGVT